MMIVTGKLTGFDDLTKKLQALPAKVEQRILQKAVTDSMRSILPQFKNAAPTHTGKQSPISQKWGTLKSNIRVAKLKITERGQKGARISTGNAPQGFWYEVGTRHQPARPWFAPIFSRNQGQLLGVLGDELGEGIEKIGVEK